jgi:hypothetical protein
VRVRSRTANFFANESNEELVDAGITTYHLLHRCYRHLSQSRYHVAVGVYVIAMEECPSITPTILGWMPLMRSRVTQVGLGSWNITSCSRVSGQAVALEVLLFLTFRPVPAR